MEKRNAALDMVRFAAAMSVAIPHLVIFFEGVERTEYLEIVTSLSVEVFFALSGFVLAPVIFDIIGSGRNVIANTWIFFVRRWMRTLPLFFFSALCHFVIFDPEFTVHSFSYFLFLQNFAWSAPEYDFFSVSWSLSIEEWFYLAFPAFLILCARFSEADRVSTERLIGFATAFIAIFVVLKLFHPVSGEEWGGELRRVTVFRLDAIAFGGLTYLLVKKGSVIINPFLLLLSLPIQGGLVFLEYTRILSGDATYVESNVLVFLLSASFSCTLVALFYLAERILPAALRNPSIWGGEFPMVFTCSTFPWV